MSAHTPQQPWRPVAREGLGRRAFLWLTRQRTAEVPEVEAALLMTLPETPLLLWMSLLWNQCQAWTTYHVSSARWVLVWVSADLVIFALRWWMHRRQALAIKTHRRPPWIGLLAGNVLWFISLIVGSYFSLLIPDLRTTLLAFIMTLGGSCFVVCRYSAFPRFAVLAIGMMTAALTLGLLNSPLEGAFQVGLMIPASSVAFFHLMLQNHDVLVTALRSQQENRRLSQHDPLTGLPNRLLLREHLAELCRRLEADALGTERLAVMCLDLDGFKAVNDRHGHIGGDWLLKNVAARLRTTVRAQDLVCRIGGDEFVVLLPGANRATAVEIAERLIEAAHAPHDLGAAASVQAGISVGIALGPDHGSEPDVLVSLADAALYDVKRSRKGSWRVHD